MWEDYKRKDALEVVQQISRDFQAKNLNLWLLSSLFAEIDKDFLRVHQQFTFDN